MPQDRLRSIVYRSFVTCDDPRGVVECKTIRKSKTESWRKEGEVENVKSQKKSIIYTACDEEKNASSKGLIDELGRSSSAQLREVSKGVQKLNKVVDSLPKGSFDRQSEDIAKDLLRGALSLQESLLMLGKLQEASKYMSNLKKKQKEKAKSVKHDRNSLRRSQSERFRDHNYVKEFQKPRLSADGSSRDCYEELREVIRESLARQNLLLKSSSKEKADFGRRLESSPDISSISSSQKSIFNSHDLASSVSSLSNPQTEKPKGSNLIAKLMGLEEFPFKPVQLAPQKQLQNGRLYNKRPIFDIDLPSARKPSFIVQKEKPEQRTLGEIIEAWQFKGLIEDEPSNGLKQKMHLSDVYEFGDDTSPIVLIKPLHMAVLEKELTCMNKCECGRKAPNTEEMLKQWKIRKGVTPKRFDPRAPLNSPDIQRKGRADQDAVRRLSQDREAKYFEKAIPRPNEKEIRTQNDLSSTRSKASGPLTLKLQKGEVIEKRVNKIQKVSPSMKQAVLKNQIKVQKLRRSTISKPNNQGKINTIKGANSRGSIISKNQAVVQKGTMSNRNPESKMAKMLPDSGTRKKNVKNEKQSAILVEDIGHQNVDTGINLKFENKDDLTETRIRPSEPLLCEETRNVSDYCTKDDSNTPCESTAMVIQQSYDHCNLIGNKIPMTRTSVRDFLLNSATFRNHAEQHLYITSGQHMELEEASLDDYGIADGKLILDCANELLECKCQQWGLRVLPVLQHPIMRSKISISFNHLVGRICNGIENLKTYSKLSGEALCLDTLHAGLEKDLWCKGVVTEAWDLGWINGFSLDEVEQVVADAEELLLTGIIEDLLSDFSL